MQERERKEKEDALAAKIEAGRLLLEYQKAEAKKNELQLKSKDAIRHHRTRGKAKGQGHHDTTSEKKNKGYYISGGLASKFSEHKIFLFKSNIVVASSIFVIIR